MSTLFQVGLEMKVDKAISGINRVDRKLGGLQKQGQKLAKIMKTAFAIGGAVVVLRSITRAFSALADAAKAGEQSAAKLNSVLKATGFAAGQSAFDIETMVQALEKVTLFNDDELRNSAAQLLTFRQITGDTFERTLKAAADLSTVLDQDLRSSIIMLGKATSDPVAQMTALSRVGIILSETQKTQIRRFDALGDTASAAAVILAEVEAQVGGASAGANTGLSGATNRLSKAWDDLLEGFARTGPIADATSGLLDLGTAILRIFTPLTQQEKDRNRLGVLFTELEEINSALTPSLQSKLADLANIDLENPLNLQGKSGTSFTQRLELLDRQAEVLKQIETLQGKIGTQKPSETILGNIPDSAPLFDINTVLQNMAVSGREAEEVTARLATNLDEIQLIYHKPINGMLFTEPARIFEAAWDEAIRNIQTSLAAMFESILLDARSMADILNSLGRGLVSIGTNALSAQVTKNLPKFATGGIVPGPVGRPQLAVVHGGENVQTPQQQQGNGANVTVNVNVSTVDALGFDQMLKRNSNAISNAVQRGFNKGMILARGG